MSCRAVPRTLTCLAVLVMSGCAVPGAILYKVAGPPAVPAKYAPPKEPMLVLVEEAHRRSGTMIETEELASALELELKANNVAPLVDGQQVHRLRDAGPVAFRNMGIAEIGQRAGAKQVLYVALRRFEFDSPESTDVVRVRMAADVKVVDVATHAVRWPATGESETFEYESPLVRLTPENPRAALRRAALEHAALEIGRWFHPWKPETMSEENRDERIR